MERPLLNDQGVYPSEEVLQEILGAVYPVYAEFVRTVTGPEYELIPQWNYYKDGKSWLCKATFRKKTIFWLSVWEGSFKVSFYFTEKNKPDVLQLDINDDIKVNFRERNPSAKLIPITMEIKARERFKDLFIIVSYKKSLT